MNITAVTTGDGSSRPATGRWTVDSPVDAPPLRFFRRVVYLRFETGGVADGIRVDPDATNLKATFHPYDYDALSPAEPALEASLTNSGGAVIATLDAARQVSQVRLAPRAVSGSGYTLEFYRLDGETLADKSTVAAGVERLDPTVSRLVEDLDAGPVGGIIRASAVAMTGDIDRRAISTTGFARAATLPAEVDFTDGRFALRLTGPANPSLRAGDLAGLHIRSYPTGPRLGISAPDDPGSATFFWRADGVVGKTVSSDRGDVEAGGTLAAALERYLNDFFTGLTEDFNDQPFAPPQLVEVALVLESDAPCILDITTFDLTYRLVQRSFPSREEKLVLRFAGGEAAVQEARIQLPGNVAVRSASLATVESFGEDHHLASGDDNDLSEVLPKEGIHVGVERWVAQGIAPSQAMSVSGVALALMATASDTEVLVELREDCYGQPSGRSLAAGEVALEQVGQRKWVTRLFPETVVLSSSLHWILMTAAGGSAVWLADAGDMTARVFEKPDDSTAGAELSAFEGLQAVYRFLSRGRQAREVQQALLTIGERIVEEPDEQDGRKVYDLTSPIGAYVDGLLPTGSVATIPLVLTSALRGLITVYPPLIEYDLE